MALRRRSAPIPAGVPEELLDRSHEVWRSAQATSGWAAEHDLTLSPATYGPLSRHRDAVWAWALAEGHTRTLRSGRSWPDLDLLAEMGIPSTNCAAEYLQRLFGVPIDWAKEARPARTRLEKI